MPLLYRLPPGPPAQIAQAFNTNTRKQNEKLAEMLTKVGRTVPKMMMDQMSEDMKTIYKDNMKAKSQEYHHG